MSADDTRAGHRDESASDYYLGGKFKTNKLNLFLSIGVNIELGLVDDSNFFSGERYDYLITCFVFKGLFLNKNPDLILYCCEK